MGTRSAIAVPVDGTEWKGRYCHWDGYADHMNPELTAIIARDGVSKARRVLVEEHYSWSQIDHTMSEDSYKDQGPGFELVTGYGVAHTTEETTSGGSAVEAEWITPFGDDWGTEWVHIIGDDGTVTSLER